MAHRISTHGAQVVLHQPQDGERPGVRITQRDDTLTIEVEPRAAFQLHEYDAHHAHGYAAEYLTAHLLYECGAAT